MVGGGVSHDSTTGSYQATKLQLIRNQLQLQNLRVVRLLRCIWIYVLRFTTTYFVSNCMVGSDHWNGDRGEKKK